MKQIRGKMQNKRLPTGKHAGVCERKVSKTMITENEIRSGNILNYQSAEGDILQCTINWQDIKWCVEDPKGFNIAHSPVPITEQVLKDCGFEAKKSTSHSEGKPKDYYCYSLLGFTYNDIQKTWWNKNLLLTNPPKYMHQLQNLIFATTGQELEYKPKQ